MSHEMITAQRRQLFHKQVREALKRIEGEMAESHSDSDSSSTNFSDVEGLEFDADANTSYLIEIIGEYRRTLAGLIMDLQLSVPQNVTAIGGPLVDLSLGGCEPKRAREREVDCFNWRYARSSKTADEIRLRSRPRPIGRRQSHVVEEAVTPEDRKSFAEQITANPLYDELLAKIEQDAIEALIFAKTEDDRISAQWRVRSARAFRDACEDFLRNTRPRKGAPA